MNKQEALEAILEVCRGMENPDGTPRADKEEKFDELFNVADDLCAVRGLDMPNAAATAFRLKLLAGAALYLLIDEVEPVTGRSLDQWLNDGGIAYVVTSSDAQPSYLIGGKPMQPGKMYQPGPNGQWQETDGA